MNGQLNRPVNFSYRHITYEGKRLVVIHIPAGQQRPHHGSDDRVYIRRGSSTAIASPDEVHAMGRLDAGVTTSPSIHVALWDAKQGERLPDEVAYDLEARSYPHPDEIPDYEEARAKDGLSESHRLLLSVMSLERVNSAYYREFATYDRVKSSVVPVSFIATNESSIAAHDVNVRLSIADPEYILECLNRYRLPKAPRKTTARYDLASLPSLNYSAHVSRTPRLMLARERSAWMITLELGKLQPCETVTLENDLFIGSSTVGDHRVELAGKIFGDNIAEPIAAGFSFGLRVTCHSVSLAELAEVATGMRIRSRDIQ